MVKNKLFKHCRPSFSFKILMMALFLALPITTHAADPESYSRGPLWLSKTNCDNANAAVGGCKWSWGAWYPKCKYGYTPKTASFCHKTGPGFQCIFGVIIIDTTKDINNNHFCKEVATENAAECDRVAQDFVKKKIAENALQLWQPAEKPLKPEKCLEWCEKFHRCSKTIQYSG